MDLKNVMLFIVIIMMNVFMILIVRMVLMELYCIIVLINLFMEQTKRNFLVIISIVFLLFLSIFIRLIYKANILDIEVKKNDEIRLETKQSNNQKNKEILNNNSDNNLAGLIYVCENKDCLLEKFKKCESSQYVIDPKVEYKAYFLVGGLIGNECNILVENNIIENVADIYKLTDQNIQITLRKFPGIGEKKVTEIIKGIEESKHKALRRLLNGLGIPHVGKKMAQDLSEAIMNYE